MSDLPLHSKTILITGAARRIGKALALACARSGADLVIHHAHSPEQAESTRAEIESLARKAWVLKADLNDPDQAAALIAQATQFAPLFALVNNAAIFEPLKFVNTSLEDWERHMRINLTAPFLLSQAFAKQVPDEGEGRIVNILDWRALRPGRDHFPYTISKAALASMTAAMATGLAPRILVNGIALGAVLPPTGEPVPANLLKSVPAGRWANLEEVEQALLFLLTGPSYITGEILHLDGGRHLV
jgi:NAD(P)-dependent dehydrogenase (short-subunit alcohol dehydrogenase family)